MQALETRTLGEVPSFATIEEVIQAQNARANCSGEIDLYPRDGSRRSSRLEQRVADIAEVDNVILYANGMAAVRDALEQKYPTSGTRIAYGEKTYSQCKAYINGDLRNRGAKIAAIDNTGSLREIEKVLTIHRPDIFFAETVANAPDMPVLDVEGVLELPILKELDSLVILDNTVASSTALPLGDMLRKRKDKKILVVDSGTKFYGLNQEMCGLIYTNNQELLDSLRAMRKRTGSLLSKSAVINFEQSILPTKEEFHRRNRQIFGNTSEIAEACYEAEDKYERFVVTYPNLPNHPNSDYVNKVFQQKAAPILYLQIIDSIPSSNPNDSPQMALARRLWDHPDIRRYCKLGQSFGFNEIHIWPDTDFPAVRIAGGTESSERLQVIKRGFKEALSSL